MSNRSEQITQAPFGDTSEIRTSLTPQGIDPSERPDYEAGQTKPLSEEAIRARDEAWPMFAKEKAPDDQVYQEL